MGHHSGGDIVSDRHPKVAAEMRRHLIHRVSHLMSCLHADAPAIILAGRARLVGDMAALIDPRSTGNQVAGDAEVRARAWAGVCVFPDCPSDAATGDDTCLEHAAALAAFANDQGDDMCQSQLDEIDEGSADRHAVTMRLSCPTCSGSVYTARDSDHEVLTCAACQVELTTRRTIDGVDLIERETGGAE